MPDPESALQRAVTASRSKLSHRARVAAAEAQRDACFVEMHGAKWSYSQIERNMRAALAEAGLNDDEIDACGVSHHNIRRAIREAAKR